MNNMSDSFISFTDMSQFIHIIHELVPLVPSESHVPVHTEWIALSFRLNTKSRSVRDRFIQCCQSSHVFYMNSVFWAWKWTRNVSQHMELNKNDSFTYKIFWKTLVSYWKFEWCDLLKFSAHITQVHLNILPLLFFCWEWSLVSCKTYIKKLTLSKCSTTQVTDDENKMENILLLNKDKKVQWIS